MNPLDMKLLDLSPEFLRRVDDTRFEYVDNIRAADGIRFLCPKCFLANGRKSESVHGVICWHPRVPLTTRPKPGRWVMLGTGFADLSLRANSSSVLLTGGCAAHFFVNAGSIELLAK